MDWTGCFLLETFWAVTLEQSARRWIRTQQWEGTRSLVLKATPKAAPVTQLCSQKHDLKSRVILSLLLLLLPHIELGMPTRVSLFLQCKCNLSLHYGVCLYISLALSPFCLPCFYQVWAVLSVLSCEDVDIYPHPSTFCVAMQLSCRGGWL
jgi:hypothetical protein